MKRILWTSLIILFSLNTLLLWKKRMLDKEIEQIPLIIRDYKTFETCYKAINKLNYTTIDSQIIVNNNIDNYSIKELVKDNSKLIFYYSETNCQKCIIDEMQKMSSFFTGVSKDNIVLIENKNNIKTNLNKKFGFQHYTINKYIFNITDISNILDEFPILFILDKNMQASNVYIPTKLDPILTTSYLSKIKHILNTNDKNN